jgi:hypothetical protein
LSSSDNGGLNWSAPAAVNTRTDVAAFTPSIAVATDGTVGISYYDLRSDTSDAKTLLASAWLLTSRDGVSWSEAGLGTSFDLNHAPDASGLFLGVSRLDDTNRSDIYFAPVR